MEAIQSMQSDPGHAAARPVTDHCRRVSLSQTVAIIIIINSGLAQRQMQSDEDASLIIQFHNFTWFCIVQTSSVLVCQLCTNLPRRGRNLQLISARGLFSPIATVLFLPFLCFSPIYPHCVVSFPSGERTTTFAATRHVLWALNTQNCVCDRAPAANAFLVYLEPTEQQMSCFC